MGEDLFNCHLTEEPGGALSDRFEVIVYFLQKIGESVLSPIFFAWTTGCNRNLACRGPAGTLDSRFRGND